MTVLLVDGDLGFVLWLSQLLTDAGHEVIPAASSQNARDLLDVIGASVDLLIVEAALNGAKELADSLRACATPLNVLALVESDGERYSLPGSWRPDRYWLKPNSFDASTTEWLDPIDAALPVPALVI